jgi:hypothetical protein
VTGSAANRSRAMVHRILAPAFTDPDNVPLIFEVPTRGL